MPLDKSKTHATTNFVGAMLGDFHRWKERLGSLTRSAYRHASRSRLFLAAIVGLAGVVVILALKFTTVVHVLMRLADVGGNVHPSGAAGVGAGGAGAAGGAAGGPPGPGKGAPTPPKKPDDPCAGYQRGYDQEKGLLDTIDAERRSMATAYNNALPQLQQLSDQFNNLTGAAMNTIREIQEMSIITAAANLFGEIALEVIAPELGIGEAVEGQPAAVFDLIKTVAEINETLNASSGTLEQMQEWALNNAPPGADVSSVLNLVNVGKQMQELSQNMIGLKNQYNGLQDKRDAEAQKVADAKAELDDCLASQG